MTSRFDRSFLSFLARRAEMAHWGLSSPDVRRVITHDEAQALGAYVRSVANNPHLGIQIEHMVTAVATHRLGHSPRAIDMDTLSLSWPTQLGSGVRLDINTNVRDVPTLRRVIERALATQMPPVIRSSDDADEDTDAGHATEPPAPLPYLPVALWHERTVSAMTSERGTALAQLHTPFQGSGWHGIGTVAFSERAFLYLSPAGDITAWGESTDSEVSMTAHTADGSAVGRSGQAHRDWGQLHLTRVAEMAIADAERQRNPSRAEPGRYTAILSPTAMGQLLRAMAPLFDLSSLSPLSPPNYRVGHKDKRGQRLFDSHITLSTDPADPDGGDFPFFDGWGGLGYPSGKTTWVEHGVLRERSVDVGTGLQYGIVPRKDPFAIRMSGGPTSVAEMITQCERGIYVHEFADLDVIDRQSGAVSGYTRNGCLLISHGKIVRPIKNFRIFESPFASLNRVLALGMPERVAFGFLPSGARDRDVFWPLAPVIAPPVMIRDFNFVALMDAT